MLIQNFFPSFILSKTQEYGTKEKATELQIKIKYLPIWNWQGDSQYIAPQLALGY